MFGIEIYLCRQSCLKFGKKQKNICISNFQNAQKRRISNLSNSLQMNEHPANSFCRDLQECSVSKSCLDDSPRSERWDLLISPIVHRELNQNGSMHRSLSSSEDDTSDEAFHRRHLPYEIQEQNASMRVYQNSSVGTGQDLSGLSCCEDFEPKINEGPCSALEPLDLSCAFAQRNRLAGEHLTQAGVLKRMAKQDCSDSPIICIDSNAKFVLQIDGTPVLPDFES